MGFPDLSSRNVNRAPAGLFDGRVAEQGGYDTIIARLYIVFGDVSHQAVKPLAQALSPWAATVHCPL
ncbi:hypothetical protein EB809_01005 [Marinobacter sp. R17]|nr:hypothetical protein EB809_01005 [Marinobacter sp. R17]